MTKVNADILTWARESAGYSSEEAANKLGIKDARGMSAVERLEQLEWGDVEPSRPLLLKMASQYHRPLLTFYMNEPPSKADIGEDFGTLPPDISMGTQEGILDALIRGVKARQEILRSTLEAEEGLDNLSWVGSVNMKAGLDTVKQSIIELAGFTGEDYWNCSSPDAGFSFIREKIESLGAYVLLISNLGSYTTTVDVERFRGFALSDSAMPFIVINDQDAKPAWSFTLLHELVHLWLGVTGVSGSAGDVAIEKFCNDVAGQILLPDEKVRALGITKADDITHVRDIISSFSSDLNLSRSMVAYRLERLDMITSATWRSLTSSYRAQFLSRRAAIKEKAKQTAGGPNYYVIRKHRLGATLINTVGRLLSGGSLSTTKAGTVLGVKPKNVRKLIDFRRTDAFGGI
ncbi:MAG: ImmA/IrrE family metallo-endopeptidase [Emcibacter sp.]|nr:ImmA/IrrE family metallo-endopeptidase [Emcibacter sp.]